MNFMTAEQFGGIVRAVLASSVGFAAAKGWVAAADTEWLVSGLGAAFVGVWSWWSKRPVPVAAAPAA